MKKPWQKISSRQIHANPYWQVFEDEVIRPDKTMGKYFFVKARDFVSVVALADKGKSIYLTRQWRYPTDGNSWETCQGGMEKGETPIKSARRELIEEIGLKAKKLKKIGFSHIANGLTNQSFHVFLAEEFTVGQRQLEGTEADMIVKKFSCKKVFKMIDSGIIKDAPTIISLYYLKLFKNKKV